MTKINTTAWSIAAVLTIAASFAAARSKPQPAHENSSQITESYLVKFDSEAKFSALAYKKNFLSNESEIEVIDDQWASFTVKSTRAQSVIEKLSQDPHVLHIQPDYKLSIPETYQIKDPLQKAIALRTLGRERKKKPTTPPPPDNPKIPDAIQQNAGNDPLIKNQWGLIKTLTFDAWKVFPQQKEITVAVIDTGVDYTHEDLVANIWRNSNEIPNNGIDDDKNGYVDDIIGWDFATNDNKPYDLTTPIKDIIMGRGNPGHGTHCAGTIGAKFNNTLGMSGMLSNVKIMPLRFISERGEGTTSAAVKAIRYAVDNGAQVLSNSWGSEGEDPNEASDNQALKDAIQYALDRGVLFVAAAGNSAYDSDNSNKPIVPASYNHDNIIAVAAIDSKDNLANFSNWGGKSVDIGAPGVAVYSTVVGNKYSEYVLQFGGMEATWDGTSMAAPHVAGALALYLSTHPGKTWQDAKQALLSSVDTLPSLQGKVLTNGKLNVLKLIQSPQ